MSFPHSAHFSGSHCIIFLIINFQLNFTAPTYFKASEKEEYSYFKIDMIEVNIQCPPPLSLRFHKERVASIPPQTVKVSKFKFKYCCSLALENYQTIFINILINKDKSCFLWSATDFIYSLLSLNCYALTLIQLVKSALDNKTYYNYNGQQCPNTTGFNKFFIFFQNYINCIQFIGLKIQK